MDGFLILAHEPIVASVYVCLVMAMAAIVFSRRVGWCLLALAFFAALTAHVIDAMGGLVLALAGTAFYLALGERFKWGIRVCGFFAACGFAGLAVTHLMPGIYNFKVIDHVVVSSGAMPFSMYLNLDKAFIGFFVLAFSRELVHKIRVPGFGEYAVASAAALAIAIAAGLFLGFVSFDPKWPNESPIWILNNFFLVCIAEEAIFRGFLLEQTRLWLSSLTRYSAWWAMGLSSLAFGLAHYREGYAFGILAAVMGGFYALAFLKSRNLFSAVLTHFLINAVHFFLFSYPFLVGHKP